jgi:hypothetical protein
LLCDPSLVSAVLSAFVRTVFAYQRRRARALGIALSDAGAATAVQRFGSFAANANLHFHTLIPDAVFTAAADGVARVHRLPPPADDDLAALAARLVRRIRAVLARRDGDAATDGEPPAALALARADAVQMPLALAAPAEARAAAIRHARLYAFVDGFSLHAATSVRAGDGAALERLARYL